MIKKLTALFPLWAILFSILAYFVPQPWGSSKSAIVPLLGLVMFGMGITLTVNDFKTILKKPLVIALGVFLQYALMPFIAFGIGKVLGLPKEILVGMVLVGCCPGGTASNVICYLAKAEVALSITLTLVSTLISFLITPILTWTYVGAIVNIPVVSMLLSILKIIVAPVVLGVLVNTVWGKHLNKFKDIFPLISVIAIVVIIAIIIGLNQANVSKAGGLVIVAVMIHNLLGLLSGYGIAKGLRLSEREARTIAIEVGMQNSGLAVALAVKYFSSLAALPGALFSIWHNLSGSFLARYWSKSQE